METIRYGSRGEPVLLLQLALSREGSFRSKPDGEFGPVTLNAVRRFQSSRGLTPDGVSGPKTWAEAEPYLLGYFTHKLRRGDTFYRLGKKYGVSSFALQAANPSLDPAQLPVGSEIVIPFAFSQVPVNVPWSSGLLEYVVKGLAARYPFIEVQTIGASVMGRPLYALNMGSGRGELFINAAHHANEWITTPLVLDFLETCAKAYVSKGTLSGRSAAALFASTKLFVTPMVDPDGVDLVNGFSERAAVSRALAIAEKYPDIPFPSGWKANIEGTDLNLNYPAGWEEAKRIKFEKGFTSPAPRDFVGKAPLSAPESRAVWEFTKAHDFKLTVSYHTQGQEIYWKYGDTEPEGARRIVEAMAAVSGYCASDTPFESGFAGYKDQFIEVYNRPGFTVEAGAGTNPLPLSQYPRLREDNLPLMAVALEAASDA